MIASFTPFFLRFDPKKLTMQFSGSNKNIALTADYTIDGRILVLPITGSGDANITMGKFVLLAISFKILIFFLQKILNSFTIWNTI